MSSVRNSAHGIYRIDLYFLKVYYIMSLREFENMILNCDDDNSEQICKEVADRFESDLMKFDDFPGDYFDFILKVLSDRKVYIKKGVWSFMLALGNESHKLTEQRYGQLSDRIISNYKSYDDEMLCLAVCDFIARKYCLIRARATLDLLDQIEEQKPADMRGFVQDGRRIMLAEEMRCNSGGATFN